MKRLFLIGVLSAATVVAQAVPVECPLGDNFIHQQSMRWVWMNSYSNWWTDFSGSIDTPLQTIPGNFVLSVIITEQGKENRVQCTYGSFEQQRSNQIINFDVGSNSTVTTVPPQLPSTFVEQSPGTYICKTTAGSPQNCAWSGNVN